MGIITGDFILVVSKTKRQANRSDLWNKHLYHINKASDTLGQTERHVARQLRE